MTIRQKEQLQAAINLLDAKMAWRKDDDILYRDLLEVKRKMQNVLDSNPKKAKDESGEKVRLVKWLRQHPAISIPDMARYSGMNANSLRDVIRGTLNGHRPRKIPQKYMEKLISFCSHYGYKYL